MPSRSHEKWQTQRHRSLRDIVSLHGAMNATGRGSRFARQQIVQAFAMLLSSQFQGFCRDLHSECVDAIVIPIALASVERVPRAQFLFARKLEQEIRILAILAVTLIVLGSISGGF